MKKLRFKLINKAGLHARPAAVLVQEIKKFQSQITIIKDNKIADAKNVLQVLSLGVDAGDIVEIIINGPDEDQVAAVIERLITKTLPEIDGVAHEVIS
ncbi:HPr family phosphocarrier protein [Pyrobaculum sp.]|uniref:HPr family phosphocarrier protein n=1 Tax=Pyrobaculum sp. TaxID=2004705 RepID=UPI003174E9D9